MWYMWQEIPNYTLLREHTLLCTILPCESCSDIFYTISDLNSHIKKNHAVKCPSCSQSFQTQSILKSHIQENHNFPCNGCGVIHSSLEYLNQHVAKHHNQVEETTDKYECDCCEFEGESLAVIVEHVILSHSRNAGDKFCCENCSFKGDSRKGLLEHFKVQHMDDIEKQNTLEECETACDIGEEYRHLKSNFER